MQSVFRLYKVFYGNIKTTVCHISIVINITQYSTVNSRLLYCSILVKRNKNYTKGSYNTHSMYTLSRVHYINFECFLDQTVDFANKQEIVLDLFCLVPYECSLLHEFVDSDIDSAAWDSKQHFLPRKEKRILPGEK